MTILVVTGTGTHVGKTVAVAAVAATAAAAGMRVAVIKPAQPGWHPATPDQPPGAGGAGAVAGTSGCGLEVVTRLARPAGTRTLATYPERLAPLAAARESGRDPLVIGDVIQVVEQTAAAHDLVLVVGTGGLLVPIGSVWTVADLAMALGASTVVVARAGLGTLNHTALTLEALHRRHVPAVVVVGAWPAGPELVHWANLTDLPGELAGIVPEGAGRMDPPAFRLAAASWLTPRLYGAADPARLRVDGVAVPHP